MCQQARSEKICNGGTVSETWGQSLQPPEAIGGLGAKPPVSVGGPFGI